MNRKSTIARSTTTTTTIRNDFNIVNNTPITTATKRRDSSQQQQQCTLFRDLDNSDNDIEIVCKTETPPIPLNCERRCIYYCECGDESQHSPVELFDSDDDDHNFIDNNFICIRYDYDNKAKDKKINEKLDGTTTNNYRHTTPLFTYMKESKQQQQQQQQQQNDINLKKTTINNNHYQLKRFDYHKSNGTKMDLTTNDNEMKTPEICKNELCTYLKLMKPSEQQKDENLLTNRRSIRVKNLNIQQNGNKSIDHNDDGNDNNNNNNNNHNKYLPLPPIHIYKKETNFDDDILEMMNKSDQMPENGKIIQKDDMKKKRLLRARVKRNKLNWRRINSLRSKGRLKDKSLDQLILHRNRLKRQRKQHQQKKKRKRLEIAEDKIDIDDDDDDNDGDDELTITNDERCEIITICTIDSDDDHHNNNDDGNSNRTIENVTNLNDLNNEERKELLNNLIGIPINEKLDEKQHIDLKNLINFEHDYAEYDVDDDDEDDDSFESSDSTIDLSNDSQNVNNVNIEKEIYNSTTNNNGNTIIIKKPSNKNQQQQQQEQQSNHSIQISETNGPLIYSKYINNHLIIVQHDLISLWTQSQLGSILNSQNMWIPNGQIKRLVLNNNNDYIKKKSINCLISMDTNFSYIELWIKEHKSNIRKYPICDIFATVYFWRHRQIGLDKKVIQLENIKGSSEHVQYVVLPNLPLIIVSWYIIDGDERKTQIKSYMLAVDYQTVASVSEFATINHYISSLHNIEDCENLVMGCGGDNRILLWNIEHGYLIANIDLYDLKPALSTLWVKCDRGFIFVVQQRQDNKLRLLAINGLNNSWKQLHTYGPPSSSSSTSTNNFNKLLNIYIENGILIAYYQNGVLCWNTQTGQPVLEDIPNDVTYIPSGKYVIILINNERILIKHALTHFLITAQDL